MSQIEKQRAAESFMQLCRGMMRGTGSLTPSDMTRIVIEVWREVAGKDVASGPDLMSVVGTVRKSDNRPVVVERWGPLMATMTPDEAFGRSLLYVRAAEAAVTDAFLHRCFAPDTPESAEKLTQLKVALRQFRHSADAVTTDGPKSDDPAPAAEPAPPGPTPEG